MMNLLSSTAHKSDENVLCLERRKILEIHFFFDVWTKDSTGDLSCTENNLKDLFLNIFFHLTFTAQTN